MKLVTPSFFRSRHWHWLLVLADAGGGYVYALALGKSYPIEQWLFWKLAYLWCGALLLNLAAVSLGYVAVTRAFKERDLPLVEKLVMSFAVGIVGLTLLLSVAGSAGLFRPWCALTIAVVAGVVGAPSAFKDARAYLLAHRTEKAAETVRLGPISTAAACGGVCAAFFVYLLLMTPDALTDDATSTYLLSAQEYARTGRWGPFPSDFQRGTPELATLLYTWGFLWPGITAPLRWMLALHLEFSCFVWTLAGVAAAARWMLREAEVPSTWTVFFLFPAAFVYPQHLGGGPEQVLAVFAAPSFLASVRLLERFEWHRVLLLGVVLGGALLTKYQGIYLLLGNGVLLAGAGIAKIAGSSKHRAAGETPSVRWKLAVFAPLVLAASALAVLLPYFVKNWIYYENPFYPLTRMGFPETGPIWQSLRRAVTWSFDSQDPVALRVPMLGSLFVLLVPFALLVRERRRIWTGILVVYVATVIWAYSHSEDRHLLVLMPLMAAVAATIVVRSWQLGWMGWTAMVPILGLQLVWGGDALFHFGLPRISSSMALINSGYLQRANKRFKYRSSYISASASLPENARVLCHAERRLLGIERDLTFDGPEHQDLVSYGRIRGPRGLYDYYVSLGVTHLLWSAPATPVHPKQAEVVFAQLVGEYASDTEKFGTLNIATMPARPPPKDPDEAHVLVLGTAYVDGLYRIDQLTEIETVAARLKRRLPDPSRRVDTDASLGETMNEAVAAVVGSKAHHPYRKQIQSKFSLIIRYEDHDVFVRKNPNPRRRRNG